jgi:DNA-binding PadR family transcriptional regulator
MRHFHKNGHHGRHSRHDDMLEWGREAIRAMRGGGRRHGGDHGGWRFGRDFEHGAREGRGRRRMFESGELRLVMLLLMETEPRHGYDIIREIETRTGGSYAPSPGIVYPTLTLLEEIGQVEARTPEGAKKLFAITEAGLSHLNENRAEAQAALARLEALAEKDAALDAGPIFRSMSNLKTALKQRLAGKPSRDLVLSVADIIDEVARKIERL